MSGVEAALASGVLKAAGDKLVSLLATEFDAITGVKKRSLRAQGYTHRDYNMAVGST